MDELYLRLLGAREALCLAQMLLDDPEDRRLLDEAVARIDAVGVALPQWSRFDTSHLLPGGS